MIFPLQASTSREFPVAVVGGTHGDERTGILLATHWRTAPQELARAGLCVRPVLANEQAAKANLRFVHNDLNRAFAREDLYGTSGGAERARARELDALLGPKAAPLQARQTHFIIDMHTAAGALGRTLNLLEGDTAAMAVAARAQVLDPRIRIYLFPALGNDSPYLPSVSRGLGVEVGPVCPGRPCPHALQTTREVVGLLLDVLAEAAHSPGAIPDHWPHKAVVHRHLGTVAYPAEGACVHPQVFGHDYLPVHPGMEFFILPDGTTAPLELPAAWGSRDLLAAYIAEPAYAAHGVAASIARSQTMACGV